jgi:hypothetical protein
MDRTNFYKETNIGNGLEYDHLYNNLSKFKPVYPIQYYRIMQEDVMRPDTISYKVYGSVAYWWLVMMYNRIDDVFTDMAVGTLLKIPNILDIYSFYKKYSLR